MANPTQSNDTSQGPQSGEDSGLEDILAVAAKLKDTPPPESASKSNNDGLIVFATGDSGASADSSDDDDAMFGSFAGGLGAGFGSSIDPLNSLDLVPLGGEGSVVETGAAEVRPAPVEEPKRNPLTALAVVGTLALLAVGAVYLTQDKDPKPATQPVQAEMSANNEVDAAVGKADPVEDPTGSGASGGAMVEPELVPAELVGETEGALGEGADGLLADGTMAGTDSDDPMAQKAGLLEAGTAPVAKSGKWDQGDSQAGKTPAVDADADGDPEPAAKPVVQDDPLPEPVKKPAGAGGNDDEVDCLLNPDLPKCSGGDTSKSTNNEVLAPKLPEKLDSGQLRDGFNKAKSKAKACGSKHGAEPGTKVKVHASIEGATGKVTEVSAQGEHAGTDLGKCVEAAVEGATFEPFKKPSQGVDYSLAVD